MPLTLQEVAPQQPSGSLNRQNQNKSADADGVRVLKTCADKLCGILQHLFNLSLSLEEVPEKTKKIGNRHFHS